jgi:hypothetical protein
MEIVIATSGCGPERLLEIEDELRALGHIALLPYTITQRDTWTSGELGREECDDDERTLHEDIEDKRIHFAQQSKRIEDGEALLVLNDTKYDIPHYIGVRLLMEMTIAYVNEKPIFTLEEPPADSPIIAEIRLLDPISLDGDIENLSKHLMPVQ